jgi:hypothetical protein
MSEVSKAGAIVPAFDIYILAAQAKIMCSCLSVYSIQIHIADSPQTTGTRPTAAS